MLQFYTLRGHNLSLWEGLEVQSQQGIERFGVDGVCVLQAAFDGRGERAEVAVVLGIEAPFFDELPQTLDEIQIGRVRR